MAAFVTHARLVSAAPALLLTHGKGDEKGDDSEGTGAASFQYWIMYSVITLLPSVWHGVHVREMPLLQIPSIVTFRGAEGTSAAEIRCKNKDVYN